MKRKISPSALVAVVFVFLASAVSVSRADAQSGGGYDLTWSSVDGGGYMFSAGGGYSLGGTIGQPDAGAMSVSGYTLVGGFWHDWGAQFEVFLPLIVR